MPLKIIRNDITKVAADAIVNTANHLPRIGSGTDSAIYEAAGAAEMLAARREIGEIAPGSCAATPGFDLPAKYVLHAVSSYWIDGTHGEERTLRSAYDTALREADRLGCRSVAFPLLATGNHGFPRALALSVAVRAFTDFLMEHDLTIYLVLFSGKSVGLASSVFDDVRSYIDDNYVEAQRRREYGPDVYRRTNRPGGRDEVFSAGAARRSDLCNAPPCNAAPSAPAPARREEADRADETQDELCIESAAAPADAASPQFAAGTLEELLRRGGETTFSEYLKDLLKERPGKDSEVYKRAEVSKQLFSKIRSDPWYQPSKDTAIQLAIGLELDPARTEKLLEKAGYVLTRSSKRDLVVLYYIERRVYSVTFINEALYDCGLPPLKTGLAV